MYRIVTFKALFSEREFLDKTHYRLFERRHPMLPVLWPQAR